MISADTGSCSWPYENQWISTSSWPVIPIEQGVPDVVRLAEPPA